jgi:hypothetical protein
MIKVLTFFSAAPVRFPHWKGHIRKGVKMSTNPHLNLKTPAPPLKTHDYIDFRTLTGNEILYNLQNAEHFRPYEYSNAFLTLGLKKGAPPGYDWETNPFVQTALQHGKKKISQLNCKVLTSLAHAWGRLGIKDPELWSLLEKHILRQFGTIEPKGLARCMYAMRFIAEDKFWERTTEMLPVYIRKLDAGDVLRVVQALTSRKEPYTDLFAKWVYPQIKEKRYLCTPSMLERFLTALQTRSDFTIEFKQMLIETISDRYETMRRVKFGGLKIIHDTPVPVESDIPALEGAPITAESAPQTPSETDVQTPSEAAVTQAQK